ncbi:MAG: tetratricopeptide repeat protein [Planctomycetes bacterium]|nr:tetratricopeptide repeat protein [Planctomycetota bacterium]MBI3846804.1 tetratricopeptide repeat protein [Planctomycetota bacterium]
MSERGRIGLLAVALALSLVLVHLPNLGAPLVQLGDSVFESAVDRSFLGMPAIGSRIHALLLHASAALLVLGIAGRLGASVFGAVVAAGLFALVPSSVDVVATREGLSVLAANALVLGAFYLYLVSVSGAANPIVRSESDGPAQRADAGGLRIWPYLLALGCFAVSLLAGPATAVFPLFVLFHLVLFARRKGQVLLRGGAVLLPALAVAIVGTIVHVGIRRSSAVEPLGGSAFERALGSLATTARVVVWPFDASPWYPPAHFDGPFAGLVASWPLAVLVVLGVWTWRARSPLRRFSFFWIVAALLPALGFAAASPRGAHLAWAGMALCLGDVFDHPSPSPVRRALPALLILVLAAFSFSRGGVFADDLAPWDSAANRFPEEALPEVRRGIVLSEREARESDVRALRSLRLEAAEAFRAGLARRPRVDVAELARRRSASELLALGDAPAAEATLGDWLAASADGDPHRADVLSMRGRAREAQGRVDAAIDDFRSAARVAADDAATHLELGSALARHAAEKGADEKRALLVDAVAEFRRVLSIRPNDVEATLELGSALGAQGELIEASKVLDGVKSARPDDAEAWYRSGVLYFDNARSTPSAESARDLALHARSEWIQALERDPNHVKALLGLADVLATLGDSANASKALAKAHALAPNSLDVVKRYSDALIQSSVSAAQKGDVAASEAAAREAVKVQPNSVDARAQLGRCLETRRDYDAAKEQFDALLDIVAKSRANSVSNPAVDESASRRAAALFYKDYGYALLLQAAGKPAEHDALRAKSRAAFQRAVELAPNDPEFDVARTLLSTWEH